MGGSRKQDPGEVAAALSEYAKNAPPIDFKASLDSLEIMEGVMRHFYLRALIERSVGEGTNWDKVDALMLKTLAAAEKVARYKHAQLSAVRVAGDISGKMDDAAVRLAGDISGKMDDVSLDELLVTIRQEWAKLGPLIDLEAIREPQELENGRRQVMEGLHAAHETWLTPCLGLAHSVQRVQLCHCRRLPPCTPRPRTPRSTPPPFRRLQAALWLLHPPRPICPRRR